MSLTFYYSAMSSAVIAHWAIEELGAPVEKVKIDLSKQEQKKPEFLALNPNGKVPTLVIDGTPIFETIAIMSYLGETYGVDKGLWPSTALGRAEAMKWMAWAQVTVGEALSRFAHAGHERFPKECHHEPSRQKAKADVERLLSLLEAEFVKTKRPYLLGDTFTLADLHVGGWVGYLQMSGFDLSKYPNLQAWSQRATQRPAFGKVMSER